MSENDVRRDRIRRVWQAAWDEGDVNALDELLSPNYCRIESSGVRRDRGQFKAAIVAIRSSFPDLTTTLDEVIIEDDKAAMRWHSAGAHTLPFLGVPATRREVAVNGVTFARFEGDKIVEESVTWDPRELLTALGVISVGQDQ